MNKTIRLNIGCSNSPTKGWFNYDNSYGIIVAKFSFLPNLLNRLNIISDKQLDIANSYKENHVGLANVVKKIPHADDSVDVVYSSHMLEHLDQQDAKKCLLEIYRVLKKGGILRLALPDIEAKIEEYIKTKDADTFIQETYLTVPTPKSLIQRLYFFFIGPRHHLWMYDSESLKKLLIDCGFNDPVSLSAGETTITEPDNLTLHERADDSFYTEAKK